jgi:hypothetical protein
MGTGNEGRDRVGGGLGMLGCAGWLVTAQLRVYS